MQRVDVYVDVQFSGNMKCGTGKYSYVIEYKATADKIARKTVLKIITDTTKNRTALFAIIDVLEHLVRPCEVHITINNNYIVTTVNKKRWIAWEDNAWIQKGKAVKNKKLWQQVAKLQIQHQVMAIYAKKTSYTDCLRIKLDNEVRKMVKDTENVED